MIWTYKKKTINSIEDMPKDVIGFVYKIVNIKTGKFYIGKKSVAHKRKTRIGKREKAKTKTRKTFKVSIKESDWKTYYGSQTNIKKLLLEGKKDEFERNILKMCPDKKSMTYFEVKYQMLYQVLEKPDEFFNDNILGKFFTKDLKDIEFEDLVKERK